MLSIKLKPVFLIILGVIILGSIFPITADAQLGYKALEPIPGLTDEEVINANGDVAGISVFLGKAFNFSISIAVVITVVMITIGGFQWMTSSVAGGVSAAKERIMNAIYGLLLILLIYAIAYTINPAILDFNLFRNSTPIPSSTAGGDEDGNKYFYEYATIYDLTDVTDYLLFDKLGDEPNLRSYAEVEQDKFQTFNACQTAQQAKAKESTKKYSDPMSNPGSCVGQEPTDDTPIYWFSYKEYTEPDPQLVSTQFQEQIGEERDSVTEYYYTPNVDNCKETRTLRAEKSIQAYYVASGTRCQNDGTNYYFEFKYPYSTGSTYRSKSYAGNRNGANSCRADLERVSTISETVANIHKVCQSATADRIEGEEDMTQIYCTKLIRLAPDYPRDSKKESCFPVPKQCYDEQAERMTDTYPKYKTTACNVL